MYRNRVPVLIFEVFLYSLKFTFPFKTLQTKTERLNFCPTKNKMCFHEKEQTSNSLYGNNGCLLYLMEHIMYGKSAEFWVLNPEASM
jgi:hypothetical protein